MKYHLHVSINGNKLDYDIRDSLEGRSISRYNDKPQFRLTMNNNHFQKYLSS